MPQVKKKKKKKIKDRKCSFWSFENQYLSVTKFHQNQKWHGPKFFEIFKNWYNDIVVVYSSFTWNKKKINHLKYKHSIYMYDKNTYMTQYK